VTSLLPILTLGGCAIHLEEEKCDGYLNAGTFA
jgi:hypothetical protein